VRRASVAIASLFLAACGGSAAPGTGAEPGTTLAQFFVPEQFYQRLGRLAAGDPLPFVGTVGALRGPGDSTLAVLALSLNARSFSFQRETGGFAARYRVDVRFERDGAPPIAFGDDQVVRVATFRETQRSDESVLYQKGFTLAPGDYRITVSVRDPSSGNAGTAQGGLRVPAYAQGSITAPLLAYQAAGRRAPTDAPQLVLNPRGSAAYGGDTLLAYVEGYDFRGPTEVPFRILGPRDTVLYRSVLRFTGGKPVEAQAIRVQPDSLVLGEIRLVVGDTITKGASTTALVSFSQDLILTDFDEMLTLLRFFGTDAQVQKMRAAPASERAALWREFWVATDPNRATPENEALEAYFARIAVANRRFRDEGGPGWRTDRGEVFIALGEPDEMLESSPNQTSVNGRVVRWTYVNLRLTLFFTDRGFGRLRLTPASRSEFERVVQRVRRIGQ
jgi:GWxTD domain-containing protein